MLNIFVVPFGLQNLLVYWQSWPHLMNEMLIVDVDDHEFFVHTCFHKIDVPKDISAVDLKIIIMKGAEIGGFGAV